MCVCVCADLCALAEAVFLELPGLDRHRAIPGTGDGDGGGLPGVHLCGYIETPAPPDCGAPPDPGPGRLFEGHYFSLSLSLSCVLCMCVPACVHVRTHIYVCVCVYASTNSSINCQESEQ